jgi:hypothetical protein
MKVISKTESFLYLSDGGDWALQISNDNFEILPQGGGLVYQSGTNLDNLANLIIEVKQHAIQNGIIWQQ